MSEAVKNLIKIMDEQPYRCKGDRWHLRFVTQDAKPLTEIWISDGPFYYRSGEGVKVEFSWWDKYFRFPRAYRRWSAWKIGGGRVTTATNIGTVQFGPYELAIFSDDNTGKLFTWNNPHFCMCDLIKQYEAETNHIEGVPR